MPQNKYFFDNYRKFNPKIVFIIINRPENIKRLTKQTNFLPIV